MMVSQGNKWVGTERGLSKFDGQNWTHYNPKNSNDGYYVNTIVIDAQSNIWLGTSAGGLLKFSEK
jgi:ligand-binding sensor domain-containing protein